MIHLALRTEYSFKQCFQHLRDLVKDAAERGETAIGVADVNNTFAHYKLQKYCDEFGIKPIFGVRLRVVKDEHQYGEKKVKDLGHEFIFIAKDDKGLSEIYQLVNNAYDQFYYTPRITEQDAISLSKSVLVVPCRVARVSPKLLNRADLGADLAGFSASSRLGLKGVAIQDNFYPKPEDKGVYQLLAGATKRGDQYLPNFESRTIPQHILSDEEYIRYYGNPDAIPTTYEVAEMCNARISQAETIKYEGNESLFQLCVQGAEKLGIDLDDEAYSARLSRELNLIEQKGYTDYFLIVNDLIRFAKKNMLVGPGRGSAAGSLVSYLLGIVSVTDPIKFGLLFERFIDINRFDPPDIDIDFPDAKREMIIKYFKKKYGEDRVRQIATISTFKPKIAIGDFAIGLNIPKADVEPVKDAIIERSGGDARAAMCIMDTFEGTEAGKEFIAKYPEMAIVSKIEGHARHSGKHAGGVIVANEPLHKFAGINSRDSVLMMDKGDAEAIGLLKIDCLGLRTLSILEDTARLAGFDFQDYYKLPLDDEEAFEVFNQGRLFGIFQFEGQALQILTRQLGVRSFLDIAAITALARPGALNSGGAARYVKYQHGEADPVYFNDIHKQITEETNSIVIYQEQMMEIARQVGGLSWEDVSTLRKAASKSLGDEFFSKYKNAFVEGAVKNGMVSSVAESLWKDIMSFGSWAFNKSHAVSYSVISYWTAWSKAHYPLEFTAANLNHARDDDSALSILRDAVTNNNIEYIPVDPDTSDVYWSIVDGKLVGGLTNIKGIGEKKALDIIKKRKSGQAPTPGMMKLLLHPETAFDILFPTQHYFGFLYDAPMDHGLKESPSKIIEVQGPGTYVVIGKLIDRDLRDRNDYQSVQKRGGELVDENQFYLNLYIRDDTDVIKCSINCFRFEELNGQHIAETAKVDETYFLVKGKVRDNWRNIDIEAIVNLNETFKVKVK